MPPVYTDRRYAGTPEGAYLTTPDGRLLLFPGLGDQPTAPVPTGPSPWVPDERSDAYLLGMQDVLPHGQAWTRDPDATFTRLLAAFADTLAAVHTACDALLEEGLPAQARELLPEWEATVGLPTACLPELAGTLAQRAQEVASRWVASGGSTPDYFLGLARALGYPVVITEYRASRYGELEYGEELVSLEGSHTWGVTVEAGSGGGRAEYGSACYGDPHDWAGRGQALECLFQQLKPAHTRVFFYYAAPGEGLPPPPDPPGESLPDGVYLTTSALEYLALSETELLTL